MMPTREQVRASSAPDGDYARAARQWEIPAGRAYLIGTGRPADASGGVDGRAQALVNPREVNPTSRGDVHEWMRVRAYLDASMRGAQ
jgi:hypothetical protein